VLIQLIDLAMVQKLFAVLKTSKKSMEVQQYITSEIKSHGLFIITARLAYRFKLYSHTCTVCCVV